MTEQVIRTTDGAIEYTQLLTITETTGKDISTSTLALALGTYLEPGEWRSDAVIDHPTASTITAKLLIGDTYKPSPGVYWLWRDLVDAPEVIPARTPLKVIIL